MMKEILYMIENVDPSDTAKLDEIDARVWCYIEQEEYVGTVNGVHKFRGRLNGTECGFSVGDYPHDHPVSPQYTRSRDALKAIRPEGWYFDIEDYGDSTEWVCRFGKHFGNHNELCSKWQKSEELAELHAIIQAIEWEREKMTLYDINTKGK